MLADEPGRRHSGAILGSDIATRTLPQPAWSSSTRPNGRSQSRRGHVEPGPRVHDRRRSGRAGNAAGADENATRDLMIGFHREMSQGVSAEQALHTVQRNAIEQNGRRLGAWTALVLYGSDR